MQRRTSDVILRVALATAVAVAAVATALGAPESAPTREESVVRWALSYAPMDHTTRHRVAAIARECAPDAEAQIFAIGEPARRALMELAVAEPPLAPRVRRWLARMQALEDAVEERGLATDLGTLAALGDGGASRVARLVPQDAAADPVRWCAERAGSLRFLPALDRMVVREAWGEDQAPFRLRERQSLSVARTEGLVAFDGPLTLEMWVRVIAPHQVYLATDEAWPDMSPDAPAAVEAGFAFRRNARGPGTATLEMTCGVAPRGWWTVESAPLRTSPAAGAAPPFEHVAIVSDGKAVRLFRDGELVAARALDGARFVRGVGDLCLGLRRGAWHDRRTGIDVRAFRVSEGARYAAEFVPAQRLERDGATLLLLDFAPVPPSSIDGRTVLRDLAGQGRDGVSQDGRFVPHVTGARLREQLASLGGGAADVVVAETEDGGGTARWSFMARDDRSGGVGADIWAEDDAGPAGHVLSVPFRVPSAGRHRVWQIGSGINRERDGPSPFAWRIDDGPWTPVLRPVLSIFGVRGAELLDAAPLGVADLAAGDHVLRLRLLSRRDAPDRRWSLWVDAFAFEGPVAQGR